MEDRITAGGLGVVATAMLLLIGGGISGNQIALAVGTIALGVVLFGGLVACAILGIAGAFGKGPMA